MIGIRGHKIVSSSSSSSGNVLLSVLHDELATVELQLLDGVVGKNGTGLLL